SAAGSRLRSGRSQPLASSARDREGLVRRRPEQRPGRKRVHRPGASLDDMRAAAEAVDALEVFTRLPNGLRTEVGERGERLSGGQRQLVSLSRAIIIDPRILVLDEATSSIDVATESRVQRGLARLLAGRTSLVIAHRLTTIRGADHVVVLDGGRVIEQGSPEELRAAGGHYAQLE